MANFITYEARSDLGCIQMSNGLTSVVIAVLSLAASTLARSDQHRMFAAWFALHDQAIWGTGMVGFDMSELPWQPDTLADDKQFILQVISAARRKTGWERLDYEPKEDWVFSRLDLLQTMIQSFVAEHISHSESFIQSSSSLPHPPVLCPKHYVYQHEHGCVLCNDM